MEPFPFNRLYVVNPLGICLRCEEGRVEGPVYGIQPKFCCRRCCESYLEKNRSRFYDRHLVSTSRAFYNHDLRATDLNLLNHKTAPNPKDRNGRRMRLFLGAEIEYLSLLREEQEEREDLVERVIVYVEKQLAIEAKKDQLERILGIKLGAIDDLLRAFILEDYLKSEHGTRSTLCDVQARLSVLERVKVILSGCPQSHPRAVFDFCLSYPEKGLSEFLDLQHRCFLVFYNEGERIMSFLSERDKESLKASSLKEAVDGAHAVTLEDIGCSTEGYRPVHPEAYHELRRGHRVFFCNYRVVYM